MVVLLWCECSRSIFYVGMKSTYLQKTSIPPPIVFVQQKKQNSNRFSNFGLIFFFVAGRMLYGDFVLLTV